MVLSLPSDVLSLVCEELASRQDLNTLFSCALTSRVLTDPAILWMYRIHNQSDYFRNDEAEADLSSGTQKPNWEDGMAMAKRYALNWALLWKSIIRSSLGTTAYPYSLYIRTLDLRNLAMLLDDLRFRESAMKDFFADDMATFLKASETPVKMATRKSNRTQLRLHIAPILELVGESITRHVSDAALRNKATVALEDLAGDISSSALPVWASRLFRLKSMTLWDGAVLNGKIAASISANCPYFDDLTFCFCLRLEVDSELSSFFDGLRPNSLQSFTAISAQGIGPKTLLAINNHEGSLKTLRLNGLRSEAIKNLSLLQGCCNLEVLEIHDAEGLVNLEERENDIFLEVVDWLGRCNRLQELSFKRVLSATAILAQVCLRENIRLKKLEVVDYPLVSNQIFHHALSQQSSLESLVLRADAEDAFGDDIDVLVTSVSQLTSLTELNLLGTSDYFKSSEIKRLANHLPNLERYSFGGHEVTDEIWPSIAKLHQLRAFNSHALTSFTMDGLINYIATLQPTNQGLLLSIMSQKAEYDISNNKKAMVQNNIFAKVGGRLEFVLYRDYNSDTEYPSD